jgi:hypothetical protein
MSASVEVERHGRLRTGIERAKISPSRRIANYGRYRNKTLAGVNRTSPPRSRVRRRTWSRPTKSVRFSLPVLPVVATWPGVAFDAVEDHQEETRRARRRAIGKDIGCDAGQRGRLLAVAHPDLLALHGSGGQDEGAVSAARTLRTTATIVMARPR